MSTVPASVPPVAVPLPPVVTVTIAGDAYTITYAIGIGEIRHDAREIVIDAAVPIHQRPAVVAQAVALAWRQRLVAYSEKLLASWRRFDLLTAGYGQPDVEFEEDNAGDFFAAFGELRRLGVQFDPRYVEGVRAIDPDHQHAGPVKIGDDFDGRWGVSSESFTDDGDMDDDGP